MEEATTADARPHDWSRREFLGAGAGVAAAGILGWPRLSDAPRLTVNGTAIEGVRTDAQGRFWRFDAPSLRPATEYELQPR